MSLEGIKETSMRAIWMWASGNNDRPRDIFSEDYVNHQEPGVEGGVVDKTLNEWKALVSEYHQSFSDSQTKVLLQIAEDNLVCTRWEFTATHTGDFMGQAPTGKVITWRGVQIDRYEDGMIVESWVDWDKYTLFEGLGLVDKK